MAAEDGPNELIFDWNRAAEASFAHSPVALLDDTLRDGLQNASVRMPALEARRAIIERAVALGVECVNLGLPSASARAFEEIVALCRFIRERALPIRVACAGRTLLGDMRRIVDVAERSELRVEAHCFVGSSPLRLHAEEWAPAELERWCAESLDLLVSAGLEPTFVTEDTTRSRPELLSRLFETALDHGATRLCLCDTVGHSTPDGAKRLVAFVRTIAERAGGGVRLDWHGHNDRGLALANALAAVSEGVDRVHATAFGIGERVGNTPLELLILNLELEGRWHHDVTGLVGYADTVARALDWTIPKNYPLLGENAFRTATGVHAAAIAKAKTQSAAHSDLIYSSVPASRFGRSQEISVGYMSGSSNVVSWLDKARIKPSRELVDYILHRAKESDHILTDDELSRMVSEYDLMIQR